MLKNLLFVSLVCTLSFNWQIYAQKKFSLSDKIDFAKNGGIGIENKEPSAIVTLEDGKYFLVADDDRSNLIIISNETRQIVGTTECSDQATCGNFPAENPKWEAMTKDGEDIYIAGAQPSNPKESKFILRFRIHKISESKAEICSVVKISISGLFDDFKNKDVPQIEGLGVRNTGDKKELIVGIRNLSIDKKIPNATQEIFVRKIIFNEKDLKLNSPNIFQSEILFRFNAKSSQNDNFPFHLSSLEYIPQLDGFLIVTSTEDVENHFFGNALWYMSNEEIAKKTFNPTRIKVNNRDDFEPDMKAEGMCLTSAMENEYRLAIAFDNDKAKDEKGAIKASKLYFYDLTVNR